MAKVADVIAVGVAPAHTSSFPERLPALNADTFKVIVAVLTHDGDWASVPVTV